MSADKVSENKVSENVFDRFMQMLILYVSTATRSLDILKSHLNIDNPMYWRQNNIPGSGKLGDDLKYEYLFHGTGCKLKFERGEIDFEFGFDGRVGGVSEWQLYCFAEDGPQQFTDLVDERLINSCLKKAARKGLVSKPYIDQQDNMYYLEKGD